MDPKTHENPDARHLRTLEEGIQVDLEGRMTYAGYLHLDRLLSAQVPLSQPPHHDEMLFILQHHVSELWMKLLVHELGAALEHLRADDLGPTQKIFARCKAVLRQLTAMWSVLETLTPSEYAEFRELLGPSSGFQSAQYRTLEFLLGNKTPDMLKVFAHDAPEGFERNGFLANRKVFTQGPIDFGLVPGARRLRLASIRIDYVIVEHDRNAGFRAGLLPQPVEVRNVLGALGFGEVVLSFHMSGFPVWLPCGLK